MKVAVIGLGMMGRQIAQVFAQHGHDVSVTDDNQDVLRKGLDEIANGPYGVKATVEKGKLSTLEAEETLKRIHAVPTIRDASKNAGLVVEAVFERLDLKQNVFAEMDKSSPENSILASNTSTLSIAKIASRATKKERILGMHFFNPAQVSKLVEIVTTRDTSPLHIERAKTIVKELEKTPIVTMDEPGFIANRLGLSLYVEASRLFEHGTASIEDIDTAMKLGYNHPMGPFQLADFVGLDTRLRNLEALYHSTGDEKWIPPSTLRQMVNQGYLGDPARKPGSRGGYYNFYPKS